MQVAPSLLLFIFQVEGFVTSRVYMWAPEGKGRTQFTRLVSQGKYHVKKMIKDVEKSHG